MTNKEDAVRTVLICQGTGCSSLKSAKIREAFESGIAKLGIPDVKVDFTGCHGFCAQGPVVVIEPEGILYTRVTLEYVPEIIQSHLLQGQPVSALFYTDPVSGKTIPRYRDIELYKKQKRVVMRNCGHINPEKIEAYESAGGYQSLRKVLSGLTPQQVIDEVKRSGLRGRGGGGFPTAVKWDLCRNTVGDQKYVICNADEGDPGAFMDRSLLEADPHSVIEGLIIAAYAAGASQGYIYVRAEYALAVKRLKLAIESASEKGYLGDNILDSGFNFNIRIFQGMSSYICGEETALIACIEGKRGVPRSRPPYPAQSGLRGKPTVVNNVKTLANVPIVISQGSDSYSKSGTVNNSGTVVLALSGKINNTGLIEVPMGTTLKEIIFDIGGGVPNGRHFKAVQMGGPAEACLPASLLKTPVDFFDIFKSRTNLVPAYCGKWTKSCRVDIDRYFLSIYTVRSCGNVSPCRLVQQCAGNTGTTASHK
jgi:NADH-quinone oxidoreductase subunit F/NADP-reducing hydrogenase subunit HndC